MSRLLSFVDASSSDDPAEHGIDIAYDVVVANPNNLEAEALDLLRPPAIIFGEPVVLLSVHLDDELSFEAKKIDGVSKDGHLALELEPAEAPAPQRLP